GYVPPSDKVTIASIGLGRQGQAVSMELLARPDVQIVAICDCNAGSKNYVEYGDNALLKAARKLLGPGYENWGEDLASPGEVQLTHEFRTSLGMGAATRHGASLKHITAHEKARPPAPTKDAALITTIVNYWQRKKISMRSTSQRPTIGTRRSR
ncbi:MAG: hypothetical protein WB676_23580, partial [Bryobacteraceae bacterium]